MKKGILTASVIVLSILALLMLCVLLILAKMGAMVDRSVQIVEQSGWVSDKTAVDPNLETAEPGEISEKEDDVYVEVSDEDYYESPIYKQIPIDENVINLLLVGQDSTIGSGASTRSDSCIIASYDRIDKKVKLVSVMRDTWVQIEGHNWNRINAAYSFGGIGLLMNTINDTYELDMQDYIIIGFDQFAKVIDRIGGIDMKITAKEASYINGQLGRKEYEERSQTIHMNGEVALIYSRCRRVGGVFERDTRQRKVIMTIYQTLARNYDAKSVSELLNFALENVRTNIPENRLFTLALELLGIARELQIEQDHVPFDGGWKYARIRGKAVLSIDLPYNIEELHEFLYD
ncbi:MAG: LCP family protein [Clostridia bacterium]|nr:LCP family protein [Clostridia bacterium]